MAELDIDPLERAAYHEAGHVALWRRFDRRRFVAKGEIRFTSTGNPHTRVTRSVRGVRESPAPSEHWMAVMAMAGRAAEALRYPEMQARELGRLSGPDEEDARRMLREIHGADLRDETLDELVRELESEAREILRKDWAAVDALAKSLVARRGECPFFVDGRDTLKLMDAALNESHPDDPGWGW